ncbi:DUF624 domain-containing protein [Vibrio hannami]|uniref:DUF624 domain-containing protein n=1 Tax=Vibrio hannami TaxID=2717094 RepID=UPI002410056C|nr:DUF624 domain-containing protein [Vibrio hannami]MDG3085315.1 DUF624 domain-containing protein [Vibrio hannami]
MEANSPLILACRWLSRLATMNLCWIALTLAGGLVFGVFPATVVVCILLRRYLNGAGSISFSEIWSTFRAEFILSNIVGWAILLPVYSLSWFINKGVMQFEGLLAIVFIAMIPGVVFGIVLLLATVIQMSFYKTSIVNSIQNGLLLLVKEIKVLMISVLVLLACVFVSYLLPIFSLFYLVTPALIAAIAMLWLDKDEFSIEGV